MSFLNIFLAVISLQSHSFAVEHFKTIHVQDLEKLMNSPSQKVFIYDANVLSTRQKVGIIPTAQLIDDSTQYSVAKFLPENKNSKLVFYCANKMCTASHNAAEKAINAGYKDVNVMVDGIYGWRDAGKKLEPAVLPPQSMKPKEVIELIKKDNAVIVDVREGEERHEVIENAQWAPLSKMDDKTYWTEFVQKLPKDKIIVLHCARGVRAKKVADRLYAEGIRTAYFKSPDEWKSEGLPVKEGPAK